MSAIKFRLTDQVILNTEASELIYKLSCVDAVLFSNTELCEGFYKIYTNGDYDIFTMAYHINELKKV